MLNTIKRHKESKLDALFIVGYEEIKMDTEKKDQQKDDGYTGHQAAGLAKLYSDYKAWLPAPGRDELLQHIYGTKAMELFKWIDAHPEAQKLLHDYHERELQYEQMVTIKPWDSGPPLTNNDQAEGASLLLDGLDSMRSSLLATV